MKIPIYHIDAFTDKIFRGNPAAVCPLEKWIDDELLQKMAAENNLSETAFFVQKENDFELRWFTPIVEVDLCGHATLAAAHVIFQYLLPDLTEIHFQSQSGILKVTRENDHLMMDFPARKPVQTACPPDLIKGLKVTPKTVLKARDYYAIFDSEDEIRTIQPDFKAFEKLDLLGVCISAKGHQVDFISRFFAPKVGIDEDPVTGSAHSSLVPYWAEQLKKKEMTAKQISRRGGELFCKFLGERVLIGGKAITYSIGAAVF
jgi:PhzF family phenazine biosynthesis protein